MKICTKCEVEKERHSFYNDKRSKDGLRSWCKECIREDNRKRKHLYRGRYKEYNKKYLQEYIDSSRFGGNRKEVLERDNYKCVQCGMSNEEHLDAWGREITVDHIDGNGRGSEEKNNSLDNLQTLCLSCHGKKDIKMREWRSVKQVAIKKGKE